ncbi:MAG: cytochrome P450, partial [Chloroflexi bacterium]
KYDLFTRQFKQNPHPTFAQMRRECPIYAHKDPDGRTIWYITRYEDIVEVLKDNDRFVKDIRNTWPPEKQTRQHTPTLQQLINRNMLFADPPDHTRLRHLVSLAFTPRRVEAMRPRIEAIAHALLDKVANQQQMELIADFALPLPFIVITDMLGIPTEDREQVSVWSQAIISPGSRGLTYGERKRRVKAFVQYLQQLFADRRQQPQDDLITALVEAESEGDRLTEAELSSMVALLLVTGYETTVNLIGNGTLALLQHPAQLAEIQANPELLPGAVEELLRFDGPVETSTTRWVRQDCTFKGYQMRRGDIVRVVLSSANRDEAVFERPNVLDIYRQDNRHLAFGLGIHYCLGAPLARLEGVVALGTLFGRFPTLRLAVPPEKLVWRSGVLFRGLEQLPLVW